METPLTYLDDLRRDKQNADIMHVRVGIADYPQMPFVDFDVSLSSMGLHWSDEFEMEFSKDLQRDMNKFFTEHRRIPSSLEYRDLTERHSYR